MGYRSDVAITLYKKDYEELDKRCKESNTALKIFWRNADITQNETVAVIQFTDVKWYDNFEEVKYIMNFLHSNNRSFHFIRIGEDVDDTEEQMYQSDDEFYCISDFMYVNRTIEIEV